MALAHETLLLLLLHLRLLETEIETTVVFGRYKLVLLKVLADHGGGNIEELLPHDEVGVASQTRLYLTAEPTHLEGHFV